LDGKRPKKFKMDYSFFIQASEDQPPQYGKGNVAVNGDTLNHFGDAVN